MDHFCAWLNFAVDKSLQYLGYAVQAAYLVGLAFLLYFLIAK